MRNRDDRVLAYLKRNGPREVGRISLMLHSDARTTREILDSLKRRKLIGFITVRDGRTARTFYYHPDHAHDPLAHMKEAARAGTDTPSRGPTTDGDVRRPVLRHEPEINALCQRLRRSTLTQLRHGHYPAAEAWVRSHAAESAADLGEPLDGLVELLLIRICAAEFFGKSGDHTHLFERLEVPDHIIPAIRADIRYLRELHARR